MQSIDLLRELNSKLLAEIAELRKVNAELKDKNAEIPDLKRKFAEIESEKVELKARIAELLRQAVEESKRRDVENAELKARIEEQRKIRHLPNFNLVADQLSMATHHEKPLVDKKMDTSLPEELIPEVIAKQSVSAVNISVMDQCDQKTLENKETNAFLDEQCEEKGPITFEAKPDSELIIKSPWNSPCPICDGKHGNYGLHGEWYRNGTEYCLTCNTSSNKFKFAIVA
ncbi:hypothetical protein GLOIN_2v1761411 [Rhizophagus irregularis DAOM 181602=DAOM 197198]|uniref:Uncharacterized protein n=1 Tax=Rhizophagus irregularis (strain DAOM 181602 / DAOM 197198 / MUCL 43194) TaxID=747089 RepID=A0A2P4QZ67_RHIID|nr:hypothetical protein GLOIN_2v1761411 [Rhizophagus irregularis DAOM 181602=DAOM 197198]POG82953.1 hypothetical protein GLOIN_2v1761411 [Rhizophagus irregularis DAOM 181602=DAOM 197198]|eukprot:XP_025189819.1 hypothetical protein GLOIN_2v1761411 [Rhizophagus irregularis DAOM 181602=DAOM 197198]